MSIIKMENEQKAHNHEHHGIFGQRTELYFSLLCGLFLLIGFLIDVFGSESQSKWFYLIPYFLAYGFGGYFITIEAFEKIKKGEKKKR